MYTASKGGRKTASASLSRVWHVHVHVCALFTAAQETTKAVLRLDEYGGDDDFSWVLLEEYTLGGAGGEGSAGQRGAGGEGGAGGGAEGASEGAAGEGEGAAGGGVEGGSEGAAGDGEGAGGE